MFLATAAERQARPDDNREAVDEAVALGIDVRVLVCGLAPNRSIVAARFKVEEVVERLSPYAVQKDFKLGIVPFYPALVMERSVIATLAQALDNRRAVPAVRGRGHRGRLPCLLGP
jgi:sugar phosphate isomerase/epimerase